MGDGSELETFKKKNMTNEEKTLLLQDLSARVLYGVKVQVCNLKDFAPTVKGLLNDDLFVQFDYNPPIKNGNSTYNIINDHVKPYLRSMSSMTEEERNEFISCAEYEVEESVNGRHYEYYLIDYVGTPENPKCNYDAIDWFLAHHLDCRGLIKKGLALQAPEGMYND